MADGVLDLVERGIVADPSEADFVILEEHRDLEPHADLHAEVLRRSCQAAIDDPRPGIPAEEVEAWPRKLAEAPPPKPALWRRRTS